MKKFKLLTAVVLAVALLVLGVGIALAKTGGGDTSQPPRLRDENGTLMHVRMGAADGKGPVGFFWVDELVTIPGTEVKGAPVTATEEGGELVGYMLPGLPGFVPLSQVRNGMVEKADECYQSIQTFAQGGEPIDAGCKALLLAQGHTPPPGTP